MTSPKFLVVKGVVFDTSGYTVLLQLLNVRYTHHRCQIGVFAHVFKVTSVHRGAVDVDTGA